LLLLGNACDERLEASVKMMKGKLRDKMKIENKQVLSLREEF
jgi:hypothetical protein